MAAEQASSDRTLGALQPYAGRRSEVAPPSTLTVWPDTNPVIAELHVRTPDGWMLRTVRRRPERQVGFRSGGWPA